MEDKIISFLEGNLGKGLYVVKVTISKNNSNITVFLDGDYGVTIDECGKVSRKLEAILEEEEEVPVDYTLNVSSAGLKEDLKYKRQFKKNVNRNLKIKNKEQSEQSGKLVYVDENKITLKTGKDKFLDFNLDQIENAKVEV